MLSPAYHIIYDAAKSGNAHPTTIATTALTGSVNSTQTAKITANNTMHCGDISGSVPRSIAPTKRRFMLLSRSTAVAIRSRASAKSIATAADESVCGEIAIPHAKIVYIGIGSVQ